MEFNLVANQSEKVNCNPNLVLFNKIQKRFLCESHNQEYQKRHGSEWDFSCSLIGPSISDDKTQKNISHNTTRFKLVIEVLVK